VAIIPLTKNQFAIVDQDDFELLNQLKWYASKGGHGGSFYAMRSFWIEKQTVTAQDFYAALIRKIEVDAQSTEEILKAVKDGEVDKHECQKIASMVESIEANLVGLKELLHLKLGECNEQNIRVM